LSAGALSAEGVVGLARDSLIGPGGLIASVQQILLAPGEPRLYSASCILASLRRVCGLRSVGRQGAVGFNYEEAAAGAIGEGIERYCAASYEWEDLTYATEEELGSSALGMSQFDLYTEEVYDRPGCLFARWKPNTPYYWAGGQSLVTGEKRYIPAPLVYVPYRPLDMKTRGDCVALSVSTGQACHTDLNLAILLGLCEVIERDALMITWMRRLQPRRLDYRQDPHLDKLCREFFDGSNLRFQLLEISLDIRVPTILAVAQGVSDRGPLISVGAAARPTRREAAIKALKEAAQTAVWLREVLQEKPDWRPSADFSNVVAFEDHVRLYGEPDMVPHADFLINGSGVAAIADGDGPESNPAGNLQWCLDRVKEQGLEPVLVDLTTLEIAELGFHVVKVFVPGLTHLTADHQFPALATPRYHEVPEKMGFHDPIHRAFNPFPHPFP
jgi:ribosomal protein S12 methylthiotransferase accessory factor